MPLIARVMERAGLDFRRARPHRGHHRTRQLHRPARRHRRGARHRARGRQARGRPVDARGLRRAPHRGRRHAAGGRGHRCAPRARLSAGVRARRPHAGRAAARAVARGGARGRGRRAAPDRHRGSAARSGLAGRRTRAEPGRSAPRARHRLGGAARRRRRRDRRSRRSRFTCARPTRSRRTPRGCRADDRHRLASLFARGEPVLSEAAARDAAAIAALHAASFRRGWSEQEVEGLLIDRHVVAHRAMSGRRMAGFILSRLAEDEAEILSVAVAARSADAGWRAGCSICICAGSRASARGRCSSKSTRTMRRRSGSTTAPAFARYPAGRTIMRAPAAREPQRWCCAAIWSDRRPLGML